MMCNHGEEYGDGVGWAEDGKGSMYRVVEKLEKLEKLEDAIQKKICCGAEDVKGSMHRVVEKLRPLGGALADAIQKKFNKPNIVVYFSVKTKNISNSRKQFQNYFTNFTKLLHFVSTLKPSLSHDLFSYCF